MIRIDDIDLKILDLLVHDSSKTFKQMAEELNIDQRTVSSRVKKLKKCGIIEEMGAHINFQKLWGVSVVIGINLDLQKSSTTAFFKELMSKVKNNRIRSVYEGFGSHDLIIIMTAIDNQELNDMLMIIKSLSGIKDIKVTTITNTLRHLHVVPDPEDLKKARMRIFE